MSNEFKKIFWYWLPDIKNNFPTKLIISLPTSIPDSNSNSLINYRLNAFIKSIMDTFIAGYKEKVNSDNKFGTDCT